MTTYDGDRQRPRRALATDDGDFPSRADHAKLMGELDALTALAWAGAILDELALDAGVPDTLASLLPNIERGDDGDGFRARFALRPASVLRNHLDLYYRAHWHVRDGLRARRGPAPLDAHRIMDRRRALEWICDAALEDWDDTPDQT